MSFSMSFRQVRSQWKLRTCNARTSTVLLLHALHAHYMHVITLLHNFSCNFSRRFAVFLSVLRGIIFGNHEDLEF